MHRRKMFKGHFGITMLLLGRCSSIVDKSRVQRSGLGPHCTAPARWGWRLARRSRIEIALSVLKRPPSLPFGTANRSLRPSVRPSSGGGVEWSKSRTVSYSNRRHGAIIAPTPTTARSTDGRRATATSAEQRTCLCIPRATAELHATPRRQKQ